jgi:dihydrofolate synthase/folylpolyglutamate synthase
VTHTTYAEVESALARRGFSRMVFDMSRIVDLLSALGDPHRAFPAIHVAGTNGKTSTTRIADALLRAHGLTTGFYTSPHLHTVRERINVGGLPVSEDDFVRTYEQVAPAAAAIDAANANPLTYFDLTTTLAFQKFAAAGLDAAVVEVGLGGTADSTNVLHAGVCAITPIGLDHTEHLGRTLAEVAGNKAGIIHPGAVVICGRQNTDARTVIERRAADVGAELLFEDRDFEVVDRRAHGAGQVMRIRVFDEIIDDLHLPLFGAHQAQNAAVALAAVQAFLTRSGGPRWNAEAVRRGLETATSPGRLEKLQDSPTVLLDGAHNPHGVGALANALAEFSFGTVIGVVAVLADKDARHILAGLEPVLDTVIVTTNSSDRALPVTELGRLADAVFGASRVSPRLQLPVAVRAAIDQATRAEQESGRPAAVVVTGSVVTVADARALARDA